MLWGYEDYNNVMFIATSLQSESVTKYLWLTLVFMWNSAPREKFNGYFWGIFC